MGAGAPAPRHPHALPLARLLLEAGADPNDGQALYNRMFEPGNDHLELLVEFGLGTGDGGPWRARGAPAPALDPEQRFVPAALAAAQAALDELRADRPGLAAAVRAARPALIVWAAAQGRPGSVELLAGLGFDVNAMGRSDAPAEDPWQTALHVAASEGREELARSLLGLGADPGLRDHRFGSTPLGWARYFGQEQLAGLLEPLTPPEEAAPGDGSAR